MKERLKIAFEGGDAPVRHFSIGLNTQIICEVRLHDMFNWGNRVFLNIMEMTTQTFI